MKVVVPSDTGTLKELLLILTVQVVPAGKPQSPPQVLVITVEKVTCMGLVEVFTLYVPYSNPGFPVVSGPSRTIMAK